MNGTDDVTVSADEGQPLRLTSRQLHRRRAYFCNSVGTWNFEMAVRAICYASELLTGFPVDEVDALVQDAAAYNLRVGVTGILLFDGGRFLQHFEGPEDGVESVYGRIRMSTSHTGLVELGRATIGRRFFPYWSMTVLRTAEAELLDARKADWTSFMLRRTLSAPPRLFGVERLAQIVQPSLPPRYQIQTAALLR